MFSKPRSTKDHHLNKLGRPTSKMLHTKSQGHQPSGHVTETICINLGYLIIRSLNIKFEFNCLNGF